MPAKTESQVQDKKLISDIELDEALLEKINEDGLEGLTKEELFEIAKALELNVPTNI